MSQIPLAERLLPRDHVACIDPTGSLRDDVESATSTFFPERGVISFSSFEEGMAALRDASLIPTRNRIFALLIDTEALSPDQALALTDEARSGIAIPNVALFGDYTFPRSDFIQRLDPHDVDLVDTLTPVADYIRSLVFEFKDT